MTNYGCSGTWYYRINDNVAYANRSVRGYENDVFVSGGTCGRYVTSSLDGRFIDGEDANCQNGPAVMSELRFVKDDPNCISPSGKYDCINGSCYDSTKYNTPGIFNSLPTCQSKCSLNSNNCDGQCITNEEYSQIQSAIAQKQRDCG